jgi:ABC-type uncharacterized transport system YnjBCD permease subunit
MDDVKPAASVVEPAAVPDLLPRQSERWQTLVDMLYLTQLFYFYVFSAVYPFFGLIYGILLLAGGISAKARKVGRICLILGIINLALFLIVGIGVLVLSLTGLLAGLGKGE